MHLALSITTYTCQRCSHRWTHSQLIRRTGQNSFEYLINNPPGWNKDLAEPTCYLHHTSEQEFCFNCLPAGLPAGWPQAPFQPSTPAAPTARLEEEMLR